MSQHFTSSTPAVRNSSSTDPLAIYEEDFELVQLLLASSGDIMDSGSQSALPDERQQSRQVETPPHHQASPSP